VIVRSGYYVIMIARVTNDSKKWILCDNDTESD
jgi:uncharacterized UBP type Zn finger protein